MTKSVLSDEKSDAIFNPADYNYMEGDFPAIGWIWEMARRSKEYRDYWDDLQRFRGELSSETRDYDKRVFEFITTNGPLGIWQLDSKDPDEKWDSTDDGRDWGLLTKATPFYVTNLKWHLPSKLKKSDAPYTYPECSVEEQPSGDDRTVIQASTAKSSGDVVIHPLEMLTNYAGRENVIMALIDISSPRSVERILNEIKSYLSFWKDELGYKDVRRGKTMSSEKFDGKIWIAYLMVYDLYQKIDSFPEVCRILNGYDSIYSDEKTVRKRYERAVALINGEYKKHLW